MTPPTPVGGVNRDAYARGVALLAGIIAAGFVVIALGWRAVARTVFVPFQLPALVSGGIVGLALVGVGCALVSVQVGRRLEAQWRADMEDLLDAAAEAARLVSSRTAARPEEAAAGRSDGSVDSDAVDAAARTRRR